MATPEPTFEDVLSLVTQLPPGQKLHLIEAVFLDLEEPLRQAEAGQKPR